MGRMAGRRNIRQTVRNTIKPFASIRSTTLGQLAARHVSAATTRAASASTIAFCAAFFADPRAACPSAAGHRLPAAPPTCSAVSTAAANAAAFSAVATAFVGERKERDNNAISTVKHAAKGRGRTAVAHSPATSSASSLATCAPPGSPSQLTPARLVC